MTVFDTVVAVVLALSLAYSVYRGMVREIFSLIAYAGGYLMALKFKSGLADILIVAVNNKAAANIIAFVIIFFVSSLIITLIGKAVRKLIHAAPGLSWVDRLTGGAIGILKAVVFLAILMFPLKYFPDFRQEITRDSFFAPHLKKVTNLMSEAVGSPKLFDRFPDMSLDGIEENIKKMKDLAGKLKSLEKVFPENNGKPLDEYTDEDKTQLDKIFESIGKE